MKTKEIIEKVKQGKVIYFACENVSACLFVDGEGNFVWDEVRNGQHWCGAVSKRGVDVLVYKLNITAIK